LELQLEILSLIQLYTFRLYIYLLYEDVTVNDPVKRISIEDDPIMIPYEPGTISHAWVTTFQIEMSVAETSKPTPLHPLAARLIFWKPLRSFGGSLAAAG